MSYKIRHIIKVTDLPTVWYQWLITNHGFTFGYKDVTVETETGRTAYTTSGSANDGCRAFCAYITGNYIREAWGSFGGPTPYVHHHDIENREWLIPWDGCIIDGSTNDRGGANVSIHVSEYTFVKMFATDHPGWLVANDTIEENGGKPTEMTMKILENVIAETFFPVKDPLTPIERKVMYCYGCIKSGKYRQDELAKIADQATITQTIAGLFLKKFLKANKNGAISMTTEGKNTRMAHAGSGTW